jgi:hypothetical protein
VQLLLPSGQGGGAVLEGRPAVVHLAATGDHGFERRQRLAKPLLQQVRGPGGSGALGAGAAAAALPRGSCAPPASAA